jgi:hypothetical protein
MGPLAGFALLYMTAWLLEMAERWRHPYATPVALGIIVLLLVIGITRLSFLTFLALSTAYVLVRQFPDVANHVNVAIYCNLLLMTGLVWSLARRDDYPTDDDAFELVRPVLQASLILVYALAGFAKLNADFFDPAVSCVGSMVAELGRLARSRSAGIPMGLVLATGVVLVGDRLVGTNLGRWRLTPWTRGTAAVVLLGGVGLALYTARVIPPEAGAAAVVGMALLVILWELVLGPLLAVPGLQAPILAFCWAMHGTLALIGFVDFGALALALLVTFIPRAWADLLRSPVRLPGIPRGVDRLHLYFAICVLAGAFSALGRRLVAGVCFNLAVLVLLWPVLSAAVGPGRPGWPGVPVRGRLTPRWLFVFPALLLVHGLTSYLGLRTAGNFTMFSNLRTEGERSNHLILSHNPLKLWNYQDDAVSFVEIDDAQARIGYQYEPLRGNRLPVVEFRKLVDAWTRAGRTHPMTLEYRGTVHTTADIVRDPVWRSGGRSWEMRLMDDRVIQDDGPNRCRW